MDRIAAASPRQLARVAGGLYLLNILGGFFAIGLVPTITVVAADAAATAHNIQANELLYRTGLLAHVLINVTNVGLAVIFYELFKVVNRRLAMAVVFFTLVATAVETAGILGQFVPLVLLDNARYSSAFTADQVQALVYMPTVMQGISYDIFTVFFGFNGIVLGLLIFRSTFLPRVIGVLMVMDGLAYLISSFADILSPAFAAHLVPYIQLPALFGEGSLCLWLLIVGVNSLRWGQVAARMPNLAAQPSA